MVNKLIGLNAEELVEKRVAANKERDANKAAEVLLPKGMPKILSTLPDIPHMLTFLHDLDKSLDVAIHKVGHFDERSKKIIKHRVICNKQYVKVDPIYNECPHCLERFEDGRPNKPYMAKLMLAVDHNYIDATFTPPNQEPGKEKTFTINPVRVVECRYGGGGEVIKDLREHDRKGKFHDYIYVYKVVGSGKDTQYLPFKNVNKKVALEEFGEEFKLQIPSPILEKFGKLSDDEVAQFLLAPYKNVLWDLWDVPEPKAEPAKAAESEPDTKPNSGSAKQALK